LSLGASLRGDGHDEWKLFLCPFQDWLYPFEDRLCYHDKRYRFVRMNESEHVLSFFSVFDGAAVLDPGDFEVCGGCPVSDQCDFAQGDFNPDLSLLFALRTVSRRLLFPLCGRRSSISGGLDGVDQLETVARQVPLNSIYMTGCRI